MRSATFLWKTGMVTAWLFLGSLAADFALFLTSGVWVSVVYPVLATGVVAGGMILYHYALQVRDRRFLKPIFGTSLAPQLLEQMVRTQTKPPLAGTVGIYTAYVAKIAGFSEVTERLSPTQLVARLNEYLTAMTAVLLAEGGTLDKYEGDTIVAFFGAPVAHTDHATRALRTALGMQQALERLRHKWTLEGEQWPDLVRHMQMRIGIHAGESVIGQIGSDLRRNYTMIGDVVALAERLEAAAKQYGIAIHSTMETLHLAGSEHFAWRRIDKTRVRGRSELVENVEILAYTGQLSAEQSRMCALFEQGMTLFLQQEWDAAQAYFAASEQLEEIFPGRYTTPSRVYIERCEYFKEHPPEPYWDGIWAMTSNGHGRDSVSPPEQGSVSPVRFTAYHPKEITPDVWYTLLVYAHLPEVFPAVLADSQNRLGSRARTYGKGSRDALWSIARGAEIVMVPELPGCHFNPSQARFLWLEEWHCIEFRLQARSDVPGFTQGAAVNGRVAVYVGPLLVAEVPIWTYLNEGTDASEVIQAEWVTVDPYQAIFVSYSRHDAFIVDQLEKVYAVLGMRYLRDVHVLRSGEEWNPAILRKIEEADIFQLCWSSQASQSAYVEQEWRHALTRADASFIRPVYWEEPMPEPPSELKPLHFAYLQLGSIPTSL